MAADRPPLSRLSAEAAAKCCDRCRETSRWRRHRHPHAAASTPETSGAIDPMETSTTDRSSRSPQPPVATRSASSPTTRRRGSGRPRRDRRHRAGRGLRHRDAVLTGRTGRPRDRPSLETRLDIHDHRPDWAGPRDRRLGRVRHIDPMQVGVVVIVLRRVQHVLAVRFEPDRAELRALLREDEPPGSLAQFDEIQIESTPLCSTTKTKASPDG